MRQVAYAAGALAATGGQGVFSRPLFWIGYLCLFVLEVATVLINEMVDFKSDSDNRCFSVFTGGSRVLVDGELSLRELRNGIGVALIVFITATLWLLAVSPASSSALLSVLGVMTFLAIGYTAAPFKLSYRSLGEIDVAITHSIGVILCGYVFSGGVWKDPLSWLLVQRMNSGMSPGRIDRLMVASLTYVLWFGLVPLFRLL